MEQSVRLRRLAEALGVFAFSLALLAVDCQPILDAEDLQALIDAAGPGGTVQIDAEYHWICRTVNPLEGQTWEGPGRLVRCPVPRTVLTEAAQAGDTTVRVQNSAGFQAEQQVGLGVGWTEAGETECRNHWFQSATPDSLTFSNGLCNDYPAGTLVYATFNLVRVKNASGVTLRGFTIDGAGSLQPDYPRGGSNLGTLRADDLLVEDLTIVNAWGDAVRLLDSERPTLRRVRIENARCGGAHWGGVSDLLVEDSTIRTVGTHAVACDHTEGGLTYSRNNWNIEVRDSCFEDIQATLAAVGSMNLKTNAHFRMERNRVCGAPHLFTAHGDPEAAPIFPAGDIRIYDNEAHVAIGLFSLPDGPIDFVASGNVEVGPCTCP